MDTILAVQDGAHQDAFTGRIRSNPFSGDASQWRVFCLVTLLLYQGLRRGEALVLRADSIWAETDTRNGQLRWMLKIPNNVPEDDPRAEAPSLKLDQVSLPEEWELMIGESKAATVAKMIQVGRANGPIVREFKRIQADEGDMAALQFLSAEADGFHATPYGTCLNSFTVDPCPKHLECFTGCRHLSATNLPEHQKNIVTLHGRLKVALEHAMARPEGSVGRANQIAHASVRIAGVEKLMTALPGQAPFPDGQDLSRPATRESVLHGA